MDFEAIVFTGLKTSSNRKSRRSSLRAVDHTLPVTSGVLQGGVIGPLLFLAHSNDLPTKFNFIALRLADDCPLCRIIRSEEDAPQLQEDLDNIHSWEHD